MYCIILFVKTFLMQQGLFFCGRHTIEGNSNDSCRVREHPVGYYEIMGYGVKFYQMGETKSIFFNLIVRG